MNSCWTREPQLPTRASSHAKNEHVVAVVAIADVLDAALGESTICGEQSKQLFIGSVMAVLLTPTPPSTGLCGNGGFSPPRPVLPLNARYLNFGIVIIMLATNSYS